MCSLNMKYDWSFSVFDSFASPVAALYKVYLLQAVRLKWMIFSMWRRIIKFG